LRSLHFAEVARYFNTLQRAARRVCRARDRDAALESLNDEERAILDESVAVWEQRLDRELRQAQIAGEKRGHEREWFSLRRPRRTRSDSSASTTQVAEQNARLAEPI
jgi:hypothetical protein